MNNNSIRSYFPNWPIKKREKEAILDEYNEISKLNKTTKDNKCPQSREERIENALETIRKCALVINLVNRLAHLYGERIQEENTPDARTALFESKKKLMKMKNSYMVTLAKNCAKFNRGTHANEAKTSIIEAYDTTKDCYVLGFKIPRIGLVSWHTGERHRTFIEIMRNEIANEGLAMAFSHEPILDRRYTNSDLLLNNIFTDFIPEDEELREMPLIVPQKGVTNEISNKVDIS